MLKILGQSPSVGTRHNLVINIITLAHRKLCVGRATESPSLFYGCAHGSVDTAVCLSLRRRVANNGVI